MHQKNTDKIPVVTIIGRPNSGKSTLINSLLNQKVAITSPKPQTTRKNASYIYSSDQGCFYLTDTPGIIHKVRDLVSKSVNKQPQKYIDNSNLIVYLIDISRPWGEEEAKSLGLVRKSTAKKILVYNKIDQAIGNHNYLAQYNFLEEEFDTVLSISALKSTHLKSLISTIFSLLPKTNVKTNKDVISPILSIPSTEFVSEIIREKVLLSLRKEVPYSVNVKVESIETDPDKDILKISAILETTDNRYKKMIIGKGGYMVKKIGIMARKEFELMSQKHVFLKLNVVVNKHWPEQFI